MVTKAVGRCGEKQEGIYRYLLLMLCSCLASSLRLVFKFAKSVVYAPKRSTLMSCFQRFLSLLNVSTKSSPPSFMTTGRRFFLLLRKVPGHHYIISTHQRGLFSPSVPLLFALAAFQTLEDLR